MISTLKKITTKAKQLYKTGKYAKWTDAIKEASKSLNKKPAKKKIGYSKERLNIVKKATPYIKNYKSKGYTKQESLKNGNLDAAYMGTTKKKVLKKKATKKATPKSLHKDTKSHNVKISVMSGVMKLSNDEKKFLEIEGKKSKGYKYRAKVLWGEWIVLKEKENGTPVQKFIVDTYEVAKYLSEQLNKGVDFTKIKGKKIK